MIVDSTRKGKRFPDSMSKTIPIWACVLNRAIFNYRKRFSQGGNSGLLDVVSNGPYVCTDNTNQVSSSWDCSLHLPLWISKTERAMIEDRLQGWTDDLETCGADIASIALSLKKPLRPLWISQKTVIWLNEVPEYDTWDFTPVILVSASSQSPVYQQRTTSEFSWNYIPGAGDDEESWARGLTPHLFWKQAYDIVNSGPDLCNQKVADIVEKDRVCRFRRGENALQITLRPSGLLKATEKFSDAKFDDTSVSSISDDCALFWLDSTNIAVGAIRSTMKISSADSLLNCGEESMPLSLDSTKAYLHLPIASSKFDRFALSTNLPCALEFARMNLIQGKRLIVCCNDGEDISICVCLAILISFFDDQGCFDDGECYSSITVTKSEMRRRLVYICKYAVNARPSRGNLKQVFNYLSNGVTGPTSDLESNG